MKTFIKSGLSTAAVFGLLAMGSHVAAQVMAQETIVPGSEVIISDEVVSGDASVAAGEASSEAATAGDIVDVAAGADQFKTLVAAVKAAGLVETLKGDGPFTVLAPTDAAFQKLPAGTIEELLKPESKDKLVSILTYHVIPAKAMAEDVIKMDEADTVQGKKIAIDIDSNGIRLNGSTRVGLANIKASNGVIHAIDSVLMPPADEKKSDAADDASVAAATSVEPAMKKDGDNAHSGGSHKKEKMAGEKKAKGKNGKANVNGPKNIVQTAKKAGQFSTLLEAAKAAGLASTLREGGPFTVFAPTDDAFAKVDSEALQNLLKPENKEKLKAVLLYHVVDGKVMAGDVSGMDSATTLGGQDVEVKVDGSNVMINDATVTVADIDCKNGVIHVIDTVLMPKE